MAVTYNKLFLLMIDKDISIAELVEQVRCSANIITRLKLNNYLVLDTIGKICKSYQFCVEDILELPKIRRGVNMIKVATAYQHIPISRKHVSQSALNIDKKIRSNLFLWSKLFSPQFVEVLLSTFSIHRMYLTDSFTLLSQMRNGDLIEEFVFDLGCF